jgi:hypothetical protein
MRDGIFVSYSHADRAWLDQLRLVLSDLPDTVRIDVWDDTRIAPGSRWQSEINEALDTAAAAVLLLSPAFFRSEFIGVHELPAVVGAADRGELRLLPVVLAACDHAAVTATYQSVHDPALPVVMLDELARQRVWQSLAACLKDVAATVTDETRISAEMHRLANDLAAASVVAHVLEKIARAKGDPIFESNELMRENTLAFLENQRCQAAATWLIEQSQRTDIQPARSKAVVRMLEQVGKDEEVALRRARELTEEFAKQTLVMLQQAQASRPRIAETWFTLSVDAAKKGLRSLLRDLANIPGRRADQVQRAIRTRFNVRDDAEVAAKEQFFALGHKVIRRQVVGHFVL